MTKSIVITYQEADESFLMTFFKRFGVKTKADNSSLPQLETANIAVENLADFGKRINQDHESMGFLPPRQNIDLTQLIGAFNNKMTIEEIDSLTKNWRNEWERDFS